MNFVKCGNKGIYLDILNGYRLMMEDEVINYDNFKFCRVANIHTLYWMRLDKDDIGLCVCTIGDHVIIDEKYIPINQKYININKN